MAPPSPAFTAVLTDMLTAVLTAVLRGDVSSNRFPRRTGVLMLSRLPEALWVILHVGSILGRAQPGCGGVSSLQCGDPARPDPADPGPDHTRHPGTPGGSKEGVKQPREIHRKWGSAWKRAQGPWGDDGGTPRAAVPRQRAPGVQREEAVVNFLLCPRA